MEFDNPSRAKHGTSHKEFSKEIKLNVFIQRSRNPSMLKKHVFIPVRHWSYTKVY